MDNNTDATNNTLVTISEICAEVNHDAKIVAPIVEKISGRKVKGDKPFRGIGVGKSKQYPHSIIGEVKKILDKEKAAPAEQLLFDVDKPETESAVTGEKNSTDANDDKPIIAAKTKENQSTHTAEGYQGLQKSAKAVDTRQEIAKAAGVSHDTIAKVEKIEQQATPEVKAAENDAPKEDINHDANESAEDTDSAACAPCDAPQIAEGTKSTPPAKNAPETSVNENQSEVTQPESESSVSDSENFKLPAAGKFENGSVGSGEETLSNQDDSDGHDTANQNPIDDSTEQNESDAPKEDSATDDSDESIAGEVIPQMEIEFPPNVSPASVMFLALPIESANEFEKLSVDEHAEKIRELSDVFDKARAMVVVSAIWVGRHLFAAKRKVKRGEWADWLSENFAWSGRKAREFMAIARRFDGDKVLTDAAKNLSVKQLAALVSLPKGDESAFMESQAAVGKPVETQKTRELERHVREWKAQKKTEAEEIRGTYLNLTGREENEAVVEELNASVTGDDTSDNANSITGDDDTPGIDTEKISGESSNATDSDSEKKSDAVTGNQYESGLVDKRPQVQTAEDTVLSPCAPREDVQTKEGVTDTQNANDAPRKPPIAYNQNGTSEWFTPEKIIDAAREVLGTIDLDPASCKLANENVKAAQIFTREDNGLSKEWKGNVWLNPPYAKGEIEKFVDKLIAEYQSGNVTAAVVLVDNATETVWFGKLVDVCAAIVFSKGRIEFLRNGANSTGNPTRGQAFIYFGRNAEKFFAVFERFGWGCRVHRTF